MQLHTYLNYGGNCEEAFKFYESHLGGKITMLMRHGEQPAAQKVAPDWENAVLHARMRPRGDGAPRRRHPAGPFSADAQRLSVAHA